MASGRRKNGRTDPLDGLEQDSAGPDRIMASKPPHNCQPLPCFKLSYLAGLRSTACADLQRRLLADLRRKTPSCNGNRLQRVLGFSMAVIGEAFTRALAGETSFLENQRMFLDRNGYLEETSFTFSFSPIRDETGVVGLFHPVTETTSRMLSERRTRALRDLATRTGNAQSADDVCTLAAQTLSDYRLDLPFAVFYLFEDESEQARLIASTGLPDGSAASPLLVSLVTPQKFGRGASAGRDVKDLPAVTLLDINMPKISGLDVLKAIRADERTRHLPVVVLTSSNED